MKVNTYNSLTKKVVVRDFDEEFKVLKEKAIKAYEMGALADTDFGDWVVTKVDAKPYPELVCRISYTEQRGNSPCFNVHKGYSIDLDSRQTIRERIRTAVEQADLNEDSVNKLICLAYHMGREAATREVSDRYQAVLAAQKERAEKCRYRHMAMAVQGNIDCIYCSDYAGDVVSTFGNDRTAL